MEKGAVSMIIAFFILILMLYWFVPFQDFDFNSNVESNFSLSNPNSEMQFYSNMRFPMKEISYKISEDCNMKKAGNMEEAFEIMENLTILDFYSVEENEEISIYCEEKARFSNDSMFIAGEGGPVKMIPLENFSLIMKGEILLLRAVDCSKPLVEIHELIHVLGFDHSDNSKNIMYPVLDCKQEIGEEIPKKINEIYSIESLPDLKIEDVSASLSGKYLNINISIKNEGLVSSEGGRIIISAGEGEIKSYEFDSLEVGSGFYVSYENIWVPRIKIEELEVSIESSGNELTLDNNQVLLSKIKT